MIDRTWLHHHSAQQQPLTYGQFGNKLKLMTKDKWATILGHSPDVADALIQSMILTPGKETP